jgi:uncharacterized protein
MSESTPSMIGQFCWHEIGTTDVSAANEFYGPLMGWNLSETIDSETMPYTVIKNEDISVGGLYKLTDEMTQKGIPPHWLPYVAVEDVDGTASKAADLGGKVLTGPIDLPGSGRLVVIEDPTGGVLAAWQAENVLGSPMGLKHGSRGWVELTTKDTEKAGKFYQDLFGWGVQLMPMGEANYTCFKAGETMVGGMMDMPPDCGEMPPCWTIYFNVDDCDAAARKVSETGGKVIMEPQDIPNVGRFSIVTDPQGVGFAIIKMNES